MAIKIDDVQVGDVVLLKGPHETWNGSFMLVEEVRNPWGLIGIVPVPGRGQAPLRVSINEVDAVYRKVI